MGVHDRTLNRGSNTYGIILTSVIKKLAFSVIQQTIINYACYFYVMEVALLKLILDKMFYSCGNCIIRINIKIDFFWELI